MNINDANNKPNNTEPSRWQNVKVNGKRILFYIITIAVLLLVYFQFDEVRSIKDAVLNANYLWLLAAIGSQVLQYPFSALNFKEVLRIKNTRVGFSELLPITIIIQFFNQVLPSANISGQGFFMFYLKKKYNMTVAQGMSRVILELSTLYLATGFFILLSFGILIGRGSFAKYPELLILLYIFLFFAFLFLAIFFALQKKEKSNFLNWITSKAHRFVEKLGVNNWWGIKKIRDHSQHVPLALEQIKTTMDMDSLKPQQIHFWLALFWQIMIQIVNMFTVYFVSQAVNLPLSIPAVIVVYSLTKLIAMASFTPSGIGFFEVTMTLLLASFGITTGAAIVMTLLTRAFTFWIPIPVGWIVYHRFIKKI